MIIAKEANDKAYRAIKFSSPHVDVIKEKINEPVTINVNGNLIKVNSRLEVKESKLPVTPVVESVVEKTNITIMKGAKQALLPQNILDIMQKKSSPKKEEVVVTKEVAPITYEEEMLKAFELKLEEIKNSYIEEYKKSMQERLYNSETSLIKH